MSFKAWWEERKRRQEEREASRYGFEEGGEDEAEWLDPEEPEDTADSELAEVPVPAGEDAEEVEEDPGEVGEVVVAEDPVEDAGTPEVYGESWWKRRLLGEPAPGVGAALESSSAENPEPVAVEPEPELLAVEPDPEPAAVEPEPEPVAVQPEPETVAVEEVIYEEIAGAQLADDDVAEVLYEEAAVDTDDYSYLDDEDLLAEEDVALEPVAAIEDASPTPVGTDVPGPRRARLEGERRLKRRRELVRGAIAAAVAAAIGVAGVVSILARDEAPAPAPGIAAKGPDTRDTITTTLAFGTKEKRSGAAPTWIALLSVDTANDTGSVIFIPPHAATGVPGRGLLAIGDALESGGVPLLLLATETLLGTPVDRYLELSDADAAVLLDEIGPLTVEVPDDVRISAGPGQARLLFGAGPQRLSPDFLVDLLYVKGLETDDVELGARHLAFWSSLFEAFAFDADGLAAAVKRSGAAIGESDASPEELARLFERLAEADAASRRLALLPVRQVGVGGSELYEVDSGEVEEFLATTVGAQAVDRNEVRIQILNGNGSPGVGQQLAERLGGEGFRVILSGNARRLNYRETLVITYDRTSKGLDLAERTRDLIGVGEVQVAAQSQGIVDLTIVVGKDFLQTL